MKGTQLENSRAYFFNVKYFPHCYCKVWRTSRMLDSDLGTTIITQRNVSSLLSWRSLVSQV